MKTPATPALRLAHPGSATRGSVLVTALIFAIIIGITLVGYIRLSTNSLKLAHRTFFADEANNVAEAGTEEAVWSFNQMGNSSDPAVIAAAWNGWTLGNTISDVYMTSMGSGYTSAPTVSFSGGGGTGAAGTATITTSYYTVGGVTTAITAVSGITLTNAGSGYTSEPTVTADRWWRHRGGRRVAARGDAHASPFPTSTRMPPPPSRSGSPAMTARS